MKQKLASLIRRVRLYTKLLALLPLIALIIFVLWKVPQWQVNSYRARFSETDISQLESKDRIQIEKDLINAENNARTTLAQIIGGLVLISGLYLTWRNVKVAEEGKLTDRFSKAVELLGSKELDIRLGGIYALERIAKDSKKDHWTVMEILTAFIRNDQKSCQEVQAIMTVIGRRKWVEQESPHINKLNLIGTDLREMNLSGTDLSDANLSGANLSGANLKGTNLCWAILIRADLSGTDLSQSNFTGANLSQAVLSGAKIQQADFSGANLNEANLSRTELVATNLFGANLIMADFTGATLLGVDLSYAYLNRTNFARAYLSAANLSNTDISEAVGLSWQQVSDAKFGKNTKLPPELEKHRKGGDVTKVEAQNTRQTEICDKGKT